jgi:hypothetical protein
MSDRTATTVDIEAKDLDYARAIAEREGVDLQSEEGFEPISIITVTVIGASWAVATVSYLLEQRRGGQVIDLRPGAAPPLYRSKELEFGLILIYLSDGSVKVDVKEPKGMFGQVLDAVTSMMPKLTGQGAKAAANQLASAVGDKASVLVT